MGRRRERSCKWRGILPEIPKMNRAITIDRSKGNLPGVIVAWGVAPLNFAPRVVSPLSLGSPLWPSRGSTA